MQNMWLAVEALGIGMQSLSAFSGEEADDDLRRILKLPGHMKIAFACWIDYPAAQPAGCLRVRRDLRGFVHRHRYGERDPV